MNKRLMLIALFANATALTADARVEIGIFSRDGLQGWEVKRFQGETDYVLVDNNGRQVLKATSQTAASGMYKEVRVDLAQTPYLNWSWKIENTLGALDEITKAGDDYPARVYVVFSDGIFFWQTQALNYVWASVRPIESDWPNAFTGNARMLAVRSGDNLVGQWQIEQRNVRADYRRLFGKDIRYVVAVALMTDTDNSAGSATAFYGDIYFSAE